MLDIDQAVTEREPSGSDEAATDERRDQPQALATDLEQRRAIAAVRSQLFGEAEEVRVARYTIQGRLGVGGMGEVFLAFDPELGRKVALKQVRAGLASPVEHERLRREARALAQLSHPNVVQVHEVGVDHGATYLAMEYVEGQTLRTWLGGRRGWSEILAVFVAAGRGLAAAHAAGVVHRDFKAENVLIGADERARVADFGLALARAEAGLGAGGHEIAGTIRYMSLEQLRGQVSDARSDQFSFCVALYEALWGTLPHGRTDVRERVAELESDLVRPPPRSPRVPRRVWTAVRRGLRRDPGQRWGSLDELLDELDAIPRRRRRLGLAAAVSLAALIGGSSSTWLARGPDRCEAASEELAQFWSPARADALAARLSPLGPRHADRSAAMVREGLDAWSARWSEARRQQCEAADDGRDAEPLARARRACLEVQRRQFEALVEGLERADLDALERAVEAARSLPAPDRCAAAELLDGPAPPAPGQRDAVESLSLALAEARAARELGRARPELVAALVDRAAALGYRPLEAEAMAELGRAELAAGSPRRGLTRLREAAKLALADDHRQLLAETWTRLALHTLTDQRSAAGEELLDLAEAAWTGLEPEPEVQARLAFARAQVSARTQVSTQGSGIGKAETEAALRRALALDPGGALAPAVFSALAEAADDEAEALEHRAAALRAAEERHGPDHPATAEQLYNLGAELHARGRYEDAAAPLARALAIWTEAGARHLPARARAHLVLADEALRAGALDTAEDHALALARLQRASLPREHPSHGDAPMLLGRIAALRGDRARSLRHAREALGHYVRADGPGDDRVLALRLDVAGSELGLGLLDRAAHSYRSVLAEGPRPQRAALAHIGLAEIELRRAEFDAAGVHLDAAAALGASALAEQEVSYEILRALAQLRRGCQSCARDAAPRIRASMNRHQWTDALLGPWLGELGLTPSDAALLGLAAPG